MTPSPLRLELSQRCVVHTGADRNAPSLALAPRDAALLAWLAIEGPTPRARLATLLWPGSPPEAARNTLRQRLHKLRKQLGSDLVEGSNTLALAQGASHDLADSLQLLGDAGDEIGGEFSSWLAAQRDVRRAQRRQHLIALAEQAESAADWPRALVAAQQALALEPLSEAAHGRLMRLHYLAGDRAAALQAFDLCERVLKDEVGAQPSPATLALLQQIELAAPSPSRAASSGALPAGVLRPPQLVGRAAELRALHQAWQTAQVVVIVAEAGMGKSRLLQAFAAEQAGCAGAAARPGDAAVPLSTLTRLLQALRAAASAAWPAPPAGALGEAGAFIPAASGAVAAAAPGAVASLLPGLTGIAADAADAGQRPALMRAFSELFSARHGLQGIWVDDLQFADLASLEMLRALIDGEAAGAAAGPAPGVTAAAPSPAVPSPAVPALVTPALATPPLTTPPLAEGAQPAPGRALRWLLAHRPDETVAPLRALRDNLVEQTRLCPLALAPLDEPALAELIDSLALPGVRGAAHAAGLMRRTGGNPLFVLETLKQAWVERTLDQLGTALPRPVSVLRLIERRLTQLSASALMLTRCAAIAGQAFCAPLAAHALGMHPLAMADAWAELEQAQVLRDQRFAHDLYFEVALASVPAAIARHMHADIAAWLQRDGAPPVAAATLALHWLAAHEYARAAPHLRRAALAAQAALDPRLAAGYFTQLSQARAACGEAAAAFTAAQDAVDAWRTQGDAAELAAAVNALFALAQTPRQRAAAFESMGVMHHVLGRRAQAAEAVASGLQALSQADAHDAAADPDHQRSLISLLNLQGIVLRHAGQHGPARQALEQALELARPLAAQAAQPAEQPGAGPNAEPDDSAPPPIDLPAVLNNLALLLQDMDDHLSASDLLQESATLQTDPLVRARVLNNLGTSLEERGQIALAYEQRLAGARLCAAAPSAGTAEMVLAVSLGATASNLARFRDALMHFAQAQQLALSMRHWREEELHRQFAVLWLELGRVNQARQSLALAEQACGADAKPSVAALMVQARCLMASGQDARAVLGAAERAASSSADHRRQRRRLLVCQAPVLPAQQVCEQVRELLEWPELSNNLGAAIPLQVRWAQALLVLGGGAQAVQAVQLAQRAADALRTALPMDMSCAEVWLTLAQARQAAGQWPQATAALRTGQQWLQQVAQDHLDEPYRDGYLRRNPVNAELLRLAASAGIGSGT